MEACSHQGIIKKCKRKLRLLVANLYLAILTFFSQLYMENNGILMYDFVDGLVLMASSLELVVLSFILTVIK